MSAFNGSGTFVISGTGLPYVTGTVISSTVANQLNTDLATGLSNCLTKDGQTVPVNNIPMGGFRLTGLGAPVAPGDALVWGQPALFSDPFSITHNQNSPTFAIINNNDPGNAARVGWLANNGGSLMEVGIFGTGYAPNGIEDANRAFLLSSNALCIYTAGTGGILFGTNTTEKMRLDANGNLGIGMTPSQVVDITRNQNAGSFVQILNSNGGANSSAGFVAANGWAGGFDVYSNAYTVSGPVQGASMRLYTNAQTGLIFDANNGAPFTKMEWWVNAQKNMDLDANGRLTLYRSNVYAAGGFTADGFGATGNINPAYAWSNNGIQAILISCSSAGVQLNPGATSWIAASSRAGKTDFTPFPADPFDMIMGHEASLFHYLTDDPAAPLRPGLYYEDAVVHYPWAAQSFTPAPYTDPDTGIVTTFSESKGLSLEQYVPLLMAAFQKQIALNATVDARLTAGGL